MYRVRVVARTPWDYLPCWVGCCLSFFDVLAGGRTDGGGQQHGTHETYISVRTRPSPGLHGTHDTSVGTRRAVKKHASSWRMLSPGQSSSSTLFGTTTVYIRTWNRYYRRGTFFDERSKLLTRPSSSFLRSGIIVVF